jgi:formylglycine-generating enzyme required for sulfatase activity
MPTANGCGHTGTSWKSGKVCLRPSLLRLPTEAEWEWAAGGCEPKGRYAWDQGSVTTNIDALLQRANTEESNIGRTTPVWMYPQGASPAGIMDLSGNVWEWQANIRDKDHNRRLLCAAAHGASSDRVNARVAARCIIHSEQRGADISVFGWFPPSLSSCFLFCFCVFCVLLGPRVS